MSIHLITINGKSARSFYLHERDISDFKSLMRTLTSGRILIVSTKFRSDLFYSCKASKNGEILKLWALYTQADLLDLDANDYTTSVGENESLSNYFLSINKLAANWYHYRLYKKALRQVYDHDSDNPVTAIVLQCDQYLLKNTSVKRAPLINSVETSDTKMISDTFSLVMNYINKKETPN